MEKKKIIAIEGIDGSGKTVQFRLLKAKLENMGYKVAHLDFPDYDSFFGKHIGRLLSGKDEVSAKNVDPLSMSLWFALDRFCAFEKFDEEYDYLILNRYVLSNAVYQGLRASEYPSMKQSEIIDTIFETEHDKLHLPVPDIYLFFDVSEEKAEENVNNKGYREYVGDGKDVYENSENIQTDARQLYIECSKRYNNISVVNCMADGKLLSPEAISEKAMKILEKNGII